MERNVQRIGSFKRKIDGLSKLIEQPGKTQAKADQMIIGETEWEIYCINENGQFSFSIKMISDGCVKCDFGIKIKSKSEVVDIFRDEKAMPRNEFTPEKRCFMFYETEAINDYIINDSIILEIDMEITNVCFVQFYDMDFRKPTKLSDAVIIIPENGEHVHKLHVNKTLLSIHSPFFENMFEKQKKRKKKKLDIRYIDDSCVLVELLRCIYPSNYLLVEEDCFYMPDLAESFEFQHVRHIHADRVLGENKISFLFEYFELADKYKLADLHSHLLKLLSKEDILKLLTEEEHTNLSLETKWCLAERLVYWNSKPKNIGKDAETIAERATGIDVLRQGSYELSVLPTTKSRLFYIGNIPWTVEVREKKDEESDQCYFEVYLACNNDNISPFWNVSASFEARIYCQEEKVQDLVQSGRFNFDSKDSGCRLRSDTIDTFDRYKSEDEIKVEITIGIEKVVGIDGYSLDFSIPTKYSDIVLVVEEKKIHVNKELLAIHSSVFDAMFFSDFKEKNQDEIVLKEVEYELFIDVMTIIYPQAGVRIREDNVDEILRLADRFDIRNVIYLCEEYLIRTEEIEDDRKRDIAERYVLPKLQSRLSRLSKREEYLKNCG